jgi:hypothetical protein
MAEELIEVAKQQRTDRAQLNRMRRNPQQSCQDAESHNLEQDVRTQQDSVDLLV